MINKELLRDSLIVSLKTTGLFMGLIGALAALALFVMLLGKLFGGVGVVLAIILIVFVAFTVANYFEHKEDVK